MLEFEGPMGQCFSRFPTVSSRKRGEKRKKDTGLTGRVNESQFTLAINRLHSFKRQPFWFHSLNSMVPVKGIDLFY